jgi:hypothetical protein
LKKINHTKNLFTRRIKMPELFLTGNEYMFYCQKFKDMYQILPQDKGSKLRPYVTVESGIVGESAVAANQVGITQVHEVTVKNGDSPQDDVTTARRWYVPKTYNWGHLFDRLDKIRTLGDPNNMYALAAKKAFGRNEDDCIIDAFFGANKTGQYGESTTNFDGNNVVAAGGTGLTSEKLIKARTILLGNEIDVETEKLVCVITAKQAGDLLADAKYNNIQWGNPILQDGKLKSWLGFEFVHKEKLPNSGSTRYIPIFAKSCVALGEWSSMIVDFSSRKDKQSKPYLYMEQTIGATRLDEKGCVKVECVEA